MLTRRRISSGVVLGVLLAGVVLVGGKRGQGQVTAVEAEKFADPPLELKSRPLWFWNRPGTTAEEIGRIMTGCRDDSGYYGFGILPAVEQEKYLTEEYFALYGAALETAAGLGMKMCLYDEYWFPSGSAGGQFARRFPNLVMKRLDMQAVDVRGPAGHRAAVPGGTLMGAVAMHLESFERIDLTRSVSEGQLAWDVPEGNWKIMVFTCSPEGPIMDYMNREATEKFLQITHEEYYKRFPKHFGTTIDSVFYDEPTLYRNRGRAWTETFNARFEQKHGRSPATLYPALWMDIGPDTAPARVALFGLRAELFATEYIGVMDRWCRAHHVRLTGHMDQEQIANVTSISGDLLKVFQHQSIPGIDEVFAYRRTQRAYKLISSAAYNWDKELVMSETYGGINDMPVAMLYRMGMDLYAKGINFMVPHAVWTDPGRVIFRPELSWRDGTYGPALPEYNRWIGRLNLMLRGGRHVADVAVLYPVAALQAGTRFDAGDPYGGGPSVPGADYMDVGEILSLDVRRDFTYLHPEVLDRRCSVEGKLLRLNNALRPEQYRALILPGAAVAYPGNLAKARRFFDAGGTVIATTLLPSRSAEFGGDDQLRQDVKHLFGIEPAAAPGALPDVVSNTNAAGGKAFFVPAPDPATLRAVLDRALPGCDLAFDPAPLVKGGNFSYLHMARAEREVYFLANSSNTPVDTTVTLRGRMDLELWDPHTGSRAKVESVHAKKAGQDVTTTRLKMEPCRSAFLVGKPR